jgi:hypothetical protein
MRPTCRPMLRRRSFRRAFQRMAKLRVCAFLGGRILCNPSGSLISPMPPRSGGPVTMRSGAKSIKAGADRRRCHGVEAVDLLQRVEGMESVESLGSWIAFHSVLCSADVRSAASTAGSVGR